MKDRIRLQFLGATGYVTGSRTLLETENTRIYVDAGLYQGPRYIEDKNYQPLETEAKKIDAVILTHSHIDHSGLLPLLVKKGFSGPVFCTPATAELLEIMLPDAGHIQEEEFKFLSKKKVSEYNLNGPIYTREDAVKALGLLETVPFNTPHTFNEFTFEFGWAGHILGASHTHIAALGKSILFSGDIGPRHSIFHKLRDKPKPADYLVMESTYGNRLHEEENYRKKMEKAVKTVHKKKSMLIIPSFAVGRTQLILYVIFDLLNHGKIPQLPVYIDSPMATKATEVYTHYPEEIKEEIIKAGFLDFLHSNRIHLISEVGESKRLNYFNGPGILISASGMCSGGRVMHHLYNRLWDRRNLLLFVGYQAEGTLGRKIIEGAGRVRIFNREIPVRSQVQAINSFSAHADQRGLVLWAEQFKDNPPQRIFINHGEDDARETLAHKINFSDETEIEIPKNEAIYYL